MKLSYKTNDLKLIMENIGVFCSASRKLESSFYVQAEAIGSWLGRHGKTLIYGGADSGLMESVARAAKFSGGRVVGIIPEILEANRKVSVYIDEVIPCCDLNDRKAIMIERSDILVALPGGVGTLDEIFTVMAAHSIGYHSKKVVLYNESGFWNNILQALQQMDKAHFINSPLVGYLKEVKSLNELARVLE